MSARRCAVEIEVLEVEHDVWCDTCLLSTAVRIWYTATAGTQDATTYVRSGVKCQECE